MKKLSLRIRLLLLFTGISCLIWICSGLFSWFESREKIDEFFDQYQILLARQLASADWSGLSADSQKATNRIIGGIDNADEEDEGYLFYRAEYRICGVVFAALTRINHGIDIGA